MAQDKDKKRAFCNRCQGSTEHRIVYKFDNSDEGETIFYNGNPVAWIGMHRWHELLQCCGCKQVSLLNSEIFSEYEHDIPPQRHRYPAEKHFVEPKWIEDLPQKIVKVLNEVYIAIQHECFILASSGIRTVLDTVFVEKVGDLRTFENKIDSMIQKGFLAERQKATIMSVIDAGSASAHRGFVPDINLLTKALRITETLLESVYIHPDDASLIKKSTPKRKAVKKSKK